MDRHLVIGIDREFEPQQVKPIVSERDGRLQKCRSDALVMPLVVNCHSDIADVGPSWARDRMNSDLTNDFAINARQQHLSARLLLREKLAPCFCRREWNLKRAGDRLGRLKYALDGLEISRLGMPNDDAHRLGGELFTWRTFAQRAPAPWRPVLRGPSAVRSFQGS